MNNSKTYRTIAGAFFLLYAVSIYRQISIRFLPGDLFRPYILYGVYVFLIGLWTHSLRDRITQKSMLACLSIETFVMFLWLTVRFLQDTLLYKDIHLMRVSGYLIVFPLIFVTLIGLYASFGLGKNEDYRIPKKAYLLLIPDTILILLMLTNEKTHFVFKVYSNEKENLEFHPNIGIIIILLTGSLLILSRLVIIYFKSRRTKAGIMKRLLPLGLGLAMPIVVIPFFFNDFVATNEVVELTAKLFFLEAMSWESCILLGMVPVNTQYDEVFRKSTVGMQILDQNDKPMLCSEHARQLSGHDLEILFSQGSFCDDSGQEIRLHRIQSGSLVYQKDISSILSTIRELHETEDFLTHKQTILSRELRNRSEKAQIELRNKIYDLLSSEVISYLQQMEKMLDNITEENASQTFIQLCLMGTYIKRRSNLRLIMEQNGSLDMNDLLYTLEEFNSCFRTIGIDSSLEWAPETKLTDHEMISVTDMLEKIMEDNQFRLEKITMKIGSDIIISAARPGCAPKEYALSQEVLS